LILDTHALSAAADDDPAVAAILGQSTDLVLPVVTLGEYRYGIAHSRYASRYERWLDALIVDCRVLDIDEQTTRHYAAVNVELRKKGRALPTNDLWIAALCRQHRLPLFSRDRHFDSVPGLQRIGW